MKSVSLSRVSKTAGRVTISVDLDQTSRPAASDLGLPCLPTLVFMNILW